MKALDLVLVSPQELQDTCKLHNEIVRRLCLHGLGETFPVLSSPQAYCPEQRLYAEPASLLPLPREERPAELLSFGS